MIIPRGDGAVELGGMSACIQPASSENDINYDVDEIEKIVMEQSQAMGLNIPTTINNDQNFDIDIYDQTAKSTPNNMLQNI